jgi:hypothetical protein
MSGNYTENWRVMSACFFATALIIGSYVIARDVRSPSVVKASDETELLEKIAAQDSDRDGLPDWQEVLYGTDPHLTDTRHLGMSDGEAVSKGLIIPAAVGVGGPSATSTPGTIPGVDPNLLVPAKGTITRALSESLITEYAKAVRNSPDGTLTPRDVKNVANAVLSQLDKAFSPAPDFRSLSGIKVSGSGPEAMKTYAALAEGVLLAYKAHATSSEIVYLKRVLENDDQYALRRIASIAKAYSDTAVGLAALPVPTELANDHLAFINATARLGAIIADFTRTDSDPIATLLALKQYPNAVQALGSALIQITGKYKQANITFAPGEVGARFAGIIDKAIAKQKAGSAKKP